MTRELPWIACYWRWYRRYRRWGYCKSVSRRIAGITASDWWQYMKRYG